MMPSPDATAGGNRTKAFAHLTAEKADLYRLIMRAFVEASDRFTPSLRPQEILDSIQWSLPTPPSLGEIEAALDQLASWGNLQAHVDTTDVRYLEDFTRQRFTFRITDLTFGETAQAQDYFKAP